jgi:hypothetical protein
VEQRIAYLPFFPRDRPRQPNSVCGGDKCSRSVECGSDVGRISLAAKKITNILFILVASHRAAPRIVAYDR